MLKKTITYKDLDGNEVTDDFYFNLSKAEIAEFELSTEGGLEEHFKKIVRAQSGKELIGLFKEVISMSIGKRSDDGKRFVKNQDIRDEFFQSDAYTVFFMELLSEGEESGAKFIRGIVPADLLEDIDKAMTSDNSNGDNTPAYIRENREPTQQELANMSPVELQEAFRRKTASQ